jgi:flagellar protein FlbD
MIPLHRLTHPDEPLFINPDLIQTVEAHPDTVITLTNASKVLVIETPDAVRDLIGDWRASIILRALEGRTIAAETQAEANVGQVVHLASRIDPQAS